MRQVPFLSLKNACFMVQKVKGSNPGPSCSKLKTLVNISLKFQTLISQIC